MKLLPFLLSILQNFWVFFHQFQSFLFLVIISVQWWFQSIKLNNFTISRHHVTEIYGFFSSFSKFYSFSSSFLYNDGFKALEDMMHFYSDNSQMMLFYSDNSQMMLFYSDNSQTMFLNHHVQWWFQSIRWDDAIL